jgi:DNA helicase-2/ATP-dependent DNA helicase PcrA
MTIHASKGLEFPYVFIVGLEENVFPLSRARLNPDELEEERRLMYVAITRAKDYLFLSYAKSRQKW